MGRYGQRRGPGRADGKVGRHLRWDATVCRLTVALVLWSLLMVGCASPELAQSTTDGPTLTPLAIDPCALVTPAEVEDLLGAPVSDGDPFDDNTSCRYATVSEGQAAYLTLVVRQSEHPGDTPRAFEGYQSDTGEPVQSIGDRAFIRGDEVNVLKGEIWLEIFTLETPPEAEPLKAIARDAVARLGAEAARPSESASEASGASSSGRPQETRSP